MVLLIIGMLFYLLRNKHFYQITCFSNIFITVIVDVFHEFHYRRTISAPSLLTSAAFLATHLY
jgi:hypothetical protein